MKFVQIFRLTATLAALWLLLSGAISLENGLVASLGVLSVALVVYFSIKMKVLEHKGQPLYFPFVHFLMYWSWLVVEIFKSNIAVTRHIIDPKMPIKPILKSIPSSQKTEVGKVIFSNSITLTPGTVAINITKNDEILVHALHQGELDDLEKGEMGPRVSMLEPPMVAGMVCDITDRDDSDREQS